MDEVDRMIDVRIRRSARRDLLDRIAEKRRWTLKRCGNCEHWMMAVDCPREHSVNGRRRGPSMDDEPCSGWAGGRKMADSQQRLRDAEAELDAFDAHGKEGGE
jgi:hypothetical protein